MIKLTLTEEFVDLQAQEIKDKLKLIKDFSPPAFANHQPPIELIKKVTAQLQQPKNIILVGNGGSRNPSLAFYHALEEFRDPAKTIFFLNTMEPDLLIKTRNLYPPEYSLLALISKSGTNVDMLEPMLYFLDYPALVVTGPEGVLYELSRRKKWLTLEHPDVSGRYSGLTACALAPMALVGLPIEEIVAGAKLGYEEYQPASQIEDNLALKLAAWFYLLETKGYIEIFSSFYSYKLFAFYPLLVQLIHESCGKELKGQSIFGDVSPESQHHTNQRFFGGRKNIAGLFFTVAEPTNDLTLHVPPELHDIKLRSGTLKDLDKLSYQQGLGFDFQGVKQDAQLQKIPYAHLELDHIAPKTIGQFMALLQYFTAYSAWLRGVNPFDQPQVERAKDITFELIKNKNRF